MNIKKDFSSEYEEFTNYMVDFLLNNNQYHELFRYYQKNYFKKAAFVRELFFHWKDNTFEWFLNHKLLEYESIKK